MSVITRGVDPFVDTGEAFPLTPNQRALWFLHRLHPNASTYILAFAAEIHAGLDTGRVAEAFAYLVDRHPALRFRFFEEGEQVRQQAGPGGRDAFHSVDGSAWSDERLKTYLTREAERPFKVEEGINCRARLVQRGPANFVLLIAAHHLACDYRSLHVLWEELWQRYRGEDLEPHRADYAAHVSAQMEYLASSKAERDANWWCDQLKGAPAALNLPTDRPRPAVLTPDGSTYAFAIDAAGSEGLDALAAHWGITPFALLLSLFRVFLHRITGLDNIVLGAPVLGRNRREFNRLVGYFVNPMVLRADLGGNPGFHEFARTGSRQLRKALAHARYPFQRLVERLHPEHDPSRSPLFQVMFVQVPDKGPAGAVALGQPGVEMVMNDMTVRSHAVERAVAQLDLTLFIARDGECIRGLFEYNTELFDRETVARWCDHLIHLAREIVSDPEQLVGQLPMMDRETLNRLLTVWNDTQTPFPEQATIPRLLAEQAERSPERTALVFQDRELSYRELLRRVSRLARTLAAHGVSSGITAALFLERSLDLVVAMAAVSRAGGAWLPLDPSYPQARLNHILEDARPHLVLVGADTADKLPAGDFAVIQADDLAEEELPVQAETQDPAYVIYTSGSTGKPKGVVVTHRNAVNFFTAMDRALDEPDGDAPGTWLALTNATFDISVLELAWTLTRGFTTIIQGRTREGGFFSAARPEHGQRSVAFSLFYFANDADNTDDDPYRLLTEGARFADRNGFQAIWTPERHFHAFGGLYPNPSVTGAMLAGITDNLSIRAGSVVLPLHSPVRIAEEWSLVDNLSKGRVGVAFASGWHADDFVFNPGNYTQRHEVMIQGIETVRSLWRGEEVTMEGGAGQAVSVKLRPRPVQGELPVWVTAAGNIETFRDAGRMGANLLTHLLGQDLTELATKIKAYRRARREAGHRDRGHVTLMLHTYLAEDPDVARRVAEAPFRAYLKSSFGLMRGLASGLGIDISGGLDEKTSDMLLDHAFDRFYGTSTLFGTPETCLQLVDKIKGADVDEISALVDFGVPRREALDGLHQLVKLKDLANTGLDAQTADYSFPAMTARHKPTHLQGTPSTVQLLLASEEGREAMHGFRKILMGGEALPDALVHRLHALTDARIYNMYGPTETTIWSTFDRVDVSGVTIGKPIANTTTYVLDRQDRPQPCGIAGQLVIGGAGVTRGYLGRPALTASRFTPDPFSTQPGQRLYNTGDLVRLTPDGQLHFLGRADQQVKLRGYRIELDEIANTLTLSPEVAQAVVMVRGQNGGARLNAFVVSTAGSEAHGALTGKLREFLGSHLPEYMVPAHFTYLDALPLNTAGKVDRAALARMSDDSIGHREMASAAAPKTRIQKDVAAVWREALGLDAVGLDENFFELGGHSLLMVRVHARITEKFGNRISLVEMYAHPTVRALALHLDKKHDHAADAPVTRKRRQRDGSVAVIGLSCRFPGAANARAFWENLKAGVESITFFTDEELRAAGVPDSQLADPNYVKAGAVLSDAEYFDAAFFGYSPYEARLLDPQHRLFLEEAWSALEDAGYDPGRYPGSVGVFAGAGLNAYLIRHLYPNRENMKLDDFQVMTANDKDFLPTRVAYKLDLRGPGYNIQTACSTSLTAVDMACKMLREGSCDMALAGASAVRADQVQGYAWAEGMIASPDGHCRAFDAQAAGTLFGSGVAALVLKPLEDALEDGDHIHAVIAGSAVNNDGASKVSFHAPSVEGQAQVISEALERAGVEAESLGYVEAHGTGTAVGDPIELAALRRVFGNLPPESLALGSVKTNFGHLDVASGAAGLIKTLLALKHGELPPNLHFSDPNPDIDFGPFYVNTRHKDWPKSDAPKRAGVSSFGIGGTNAHVILEEPPQRPPTAPPPDLSLLLLSAKTETALDRAAQNLADHFQEHPEVSVADAAYTLQVGRAHFSHRRFLVCGDASDAAAGLIDPERTFDSEVRRPDVVFLFPGGGAQYPNMGRELYEQEPVYREAVDRCAQILQPVLNRDLRDLLYPDGSDATAAAETGLRRISLMLPAVFTTSYALAQLWQHWGVQPAAMIGHSLGEYVAACLAGVFSLEDALKLVAERGRLFETLPKGAMLSVPLSETMLSEHLGAEVAPAAINGPESCVVSGTPEAVDRLDRTLADMGVTCRRLHIDVAAHSPLLEPILEPFRDFVARLDLKPPRLPFISNITGAWISPERAVNPNYWRDHLAKTVRFDSGLSLLFEDNERLFIEIGPGRSLSSLVSRHPERPPAAGALSTMRHPLDPVGDRAFLLQSLGKAWAAGVDIDWRSFHGDAKRRRVPLPTYPFERKRYFIQAPDIQVSGGGALLPESNLGPQTEREAQRLNPTERAVIQIWSELLGTEDIGSHANFFDLGGDSLLATRVKTHLRDRLGADLSLQDLFTYPTPAALAARIGEQTGPALPPITPVSRQGDLPLSFAQQRLWFLDQLEGPSATYNMREALRLRGRLDVGRLETTLETTVRRHETLRTRFPARNGQPVQLIENQPRLALRMLDLSQVPKKAREETARRLTTTEVQRPFDLANGPLARFTLLRLSETEHIFLVAKHHIIGDGWSIGIIIHELTHGYKTDEPLPPLPVQYADYAAWQHQVMETETASLEWWREHLAQAPALLELPTDRPRPAVQSFRGNKHRFRLPAETTAGLHRLANDRGATLFMVLEAAFAAQLSRYTGSEDICLGSPIANRQRKEIEPLIGFFVNTLVLRNDLGGDPAFGELLDRTRATALDAYAHQDAPFERVVDAVQPERSLGFTPLFQVMVILQNVVMDLQDLPGLQLSPQPIDHVSAMFDLTLFMEEKDGALDCMFEYNSDLFDAATMIRWAEHFRVLLDGLLEDPETPVSRLPLMPADEKARTLVTWNQTVDPTPFQDLPALIARSAGQFPDRIALQWPGGFLLTYAELDRRTAALAGLLRHKGCGPETLVGVMTERNAGMLIALLAVQRAGAAYVPLDPAFPPQRLAYMLADAQAPLLILGKGLTAPDHSGADLYIDENGLPIEGEDVQSAPLPKVSPDLLAYTIYTSGSTGKPKGVQLSRGALANFLRAMRPVTGLDRDDRLLAVTTVSFDIAALELYLPLLVGASITLASPDQANDGLRLAELLNRHTAMQATPASWRLLRAADWQGAPVKALCGGEALPRDLAAWLAPRVTTLVNLYGPTETAIWSTSHPVEDPTSTGGNESIGRPIANNRVYILDRNGLPVPTGIAGELTIGGSGLARGYRNRPGHTAERFVPDLFCRDKANECGRLYRTGDLVRYLPDGNIDFLGRIDHQVKVRGYRIELPEIEAVLLDQAAVSQAVVSTVPDASDENQLTAWLVLNEETSEDVDDESLDDWAHAWDDAYRDDAVVDDPTFHIGGWNDSYTGAPIPAEQMRGWMDGTVNRLLETSPGRVLELGCGTGLLLFRIAAKAEHYHGRDTAASALAHIERHLDNAGLDLNRVSLAHKPAHDFEDITPRTYDTVILNSVVQYFPNAAYLLRVLEGAVEAVRSGGRIFIGDVRALHLLTAFHAATCLAKARDGETLGTFGKRVNESMRRENELVLAPAFFQNLPHLMPRISRVEQRLKPGRAKNEMTCFRYDVILHIEGETQPQPPRQLPYRADFSFDGSENLVLTQIPNPRLVREAALCRLLEEGEVSTVGELRRLLPEETGIEPDDLVTEAEAAGYHVVLTFDERPDSYRAWCYRDPVPGTPAPRKTLNESWWRPLANRPDLGRLIRDLTPHLRRCLGESLPDYAVPSSFVLLDEMPLTPNGKVDRGALQRQHAPALFDVDDGKAPETEIQQKLARVWTDVLDLPFTPSVNRSFFELGGHSLLATRVIAHINAAFRTDLAVRELFAAPTIAAFARVIGKAHTPSQAPILPVPREGRLPLSFAQQRLWFLDQMEGASATYNMRQALRLRGPLD
nr:amino acid adenylation domain-containing protein [Acidobacteriota bacterium]